MTEHGFPMQCWICESTDQVEWKQGNGPRPLRPQDLQITDDRYGVTLPLWRCRRCGFIHADRDDVGDLIALYEDLVDDGYDRSQASRARQMRWLVELGRHHAPEARTGLDIGAATGLLVRAGRDVGLDMAGVEPSVSLVDRARETNDVELLRGVYPHPELEGRRFDLVFVVDVIEHVADPIALLRSCAEALAPGGIALVVTPDIGSVTARLMGRRWWHLRLAHVGYFDSRSFRAAADRSGLELVDEIRARWFFRVEYLAQRLERYLPVGWINRLSQRFEIGRRAYARTVPLNLHDSTVFVLRRAVA